MKRMQGIDPNGIPRVWAEGGTFKEAQTNLAEAIIDYVKQRPDTGPVSRWRAEYDFRFPGEASQRSIPVHTSLEESQ